MRFPTVVVRGDVLRSWLTVYDCSRVRFAEELGVSKACVSQLLTSRHEPSAHLLAKLITITELPFDRLFEIVPESLPVSSKRAMRRKNGNGNGHARRHPVQFRRASSRR